MLWEILVPKEINGKKVDISYHKEWDKKVKEISGGLTILKPVKGQWISPNNEHLDEPMVPVRIICNQHQIEKIMEITLKHYSQEEVVAYKISDTVIKKRLVK